MTTEPNRVQKGVSTGGQFAPGTHSEAGVSLAPTAASRPVEALVRFQVWQGDYAVEIGTARFDARSILAGMSPEERDDMEDHSEMADVLYFEAVRRGLVQEHDGPFGLEIRDAIDEAQEADPDVFRPVDPSREIRAEKAILDTPLTPYEIGARADGNGIVTGLATFDMSDLVNADHEEHLDQIGNRLVGNELLMEPTASPVSVTPDGSIVMRLEGDASQIISDFDEDELAAFEAGQSAAQTGEQA